MDVGRVCVPGDIVGSTTDGLKLGPGLKVDDKGNIACYRAGLLRGREGKVYWIDCNNKRVRSHVTRDQIKISSDT